MPLAVTEGSTLWMIKGCLILQHVVTGEGGHRYLAPSPPHRLPARRKIPPAIAGIKTGSVARKDDKKRK
jgi:hypothetical protein